VAEEAKAAAEWISKSYTTEDSFNLSDHMPKPIPIFVRHHPSNMQT
jgi:hypothetical protein